MAFLARPDRTTPSRSKRQRRKIATVAAIVFTVFVLLGVWMWIAPRMPLADLIIALQPGLLRKGAAVLIFMATYLVFAIGRLPRLPH